MLLKLADAFSFFGKIVILGNPILNIYFNLHFMGFDFIN